MTTALSAVVRPRPVDDPALRLLVLHHAVGSRLARTRRVPHFPDDADGCLVETPGRDPMSTMPVPGNATDLGAQLLTACVLCWTRHSSCWGVTEIRAKGATG
ncbi:hypothetical protein AV521_32605 [Streptomyces sp. IMTB 2501]|uniref:hypothetical protein n=1 Tax=Streptomyces sp. IMTB 2501 TaxID=1776340 RepID=UPI00096F430C|nr:hypothetical protein [Streptomyces sp. IMTB 2501]OLZ65409.1 hypothetical protein AV521_32605 [Streptomyces sp. IMTB 2501]